MELITPIKQKEWGWPAVVNFILGGAGTGFYLVSSLEIIVTGDTSAMSYPVSFGLVASLLVGLGFLVLTTEAGRPWRARHFVRRVSRSWISREILAGAVFIPTAIFNVLFPHPAFCFVALVAALCFMISQGFIVYSCTGIRAWNVSIIPFFFISSGFASGSALVLLMAASVSLPIRRSLVVMGMMSLVFNITAWLFYLRWSRTAPFQFATRALRRPTSMILTVGLGHIVPLLLLTLLMVRYADPGVKLQHMLSALSGLTMLSGVMAQKTGIISGACYTRGVALRS